MSTQDTVYCIINSNCITDLRANRPVMQDMLLLAETRVRRSLDTESLKILVHAFVTSRVDYCNSVLASASKTITYELQRVPNAAARLITCTSKYDCGLSALLHDDLHWLDITQRVQYKLAVTVHRRLRNQAPTYLIDYCVPVSDVAGRRHLRSASRHQLTVPRVRSAPSVAVPLLLLVLQSGIHCLTVCAIQLLDQTSFDAV